MLAAVETMTKTDPVRLPRRHEPDVAAEATARESVHVVSPQKLRNARMRRKPQRIGIVEYIGVDPLVLEPRVEMIEEGHPYADTV